MKKFLLIELIIIFGISIILVSNTYSQRDFSTIPLPKDIEIRTPSPDLPREILAFSGKWKGSWQNTMDFILVITEINKEKAEVIYAYGDAPVWNIRRGYEYYSAKVITDKKPKIQFRSRFGSSWFIFEMEADLRTLKGIYEPVNFPNRKAVMVKIE
jgi:hypothetical protein